MLQRTPSLTELAKSHLKERILNDEFEDGRIPSEAELADELQVSRTTIRDALSRLENEGAIYRKQGAGTFVNKPGLQIKSRLEEIWTYEDVIRAHGYTPSTQIIDLHTEPAEEEVATSLDITIGTEVLIVKKLFLADDQPVIFANNRIATSLFENPYTAQDFRTPVYLFLERSIPIRLAYYLSEIVPITAEPELAEILHIKSNTALLSFSEIGYSADNKPVIRSTSCFRDDLIRLRLIRRQVM